MMQRAPTIALIACDGKTEELVQLLRPYREALQTWRIAATQEAAVAAEWLGLSVCRLKCNAQGGLLQAGALIIEGAVDTMIFLSDPLSRTPSEADAAALLRTAVLHDVLLATNAATARCVLESCFGVMDKRLPRLSEALAAS